MIQNCLIRREMATKKIGGRQRFSAVAAAPPPFLQFITYIPGYRKLYQLSIENGD